MSNKEEVIKQTMNVYADLEKEVANTFLSLQKQEVLELMHPFFFERLCSYFKKEIPEQYDLIYPLFLSDLDTIPQFKENYKNLIVAVINKAKDENMSTINLEFIKENLISTNSKPLNVDDLLINEKDTMVPWKEIISEIDTNITVVLNNIKHLGRQIIDINEIEEAQKQVKGKKKKNEIIDYLSKTKLMYIFLTYMLDISGKKEFFDYTGKHLIWEIIMNPKNKNYAEKITQQANLILSKK